MNTSFVMEVLLDAKLSLTILTVKFARLNIIYQINERLIAHLLLNELAERYETII